MAGVGSHLHFYQSAWSMHGQPAAEVMTQLPGLLCEGKSGDLLRFDVSRFQEDLLHREGSGFRRSSDVFQVSGSQRTVPSSSWMGK